MKPDKKPAGYTSVAVYIMAEGVARVVEFLNKTFDAVELRRHDKPDGSIMHMELRIDDTVVMLAAAGGEWPAFPVWLHVYVDDVDETYTRALAAGGVAVQAPMRKDGDSDRRGGVTDPAGNTWWIATQVE